MVDSVLERSPRYQRMLIGAPKRKEEPEIPLKNSNSEKRVKDFLEKIEKKGSKEDVENALKSIDNLLSETAELLLLSKKETSTIKNSATSFLGDFKKTQTIKDAEFLKAYQFITFLDNFINKAVELRLFFLEEALKVGQLYNTNSNDEYKAHLVGLEVTNNLVRSAQTLFAKYAKILAANNSEAKIAEIAEGFKNVNMFYGLSNIYINEAKIRNSLEVKTLLESISVTLKQVIDEAKEKAYKSANNTTNSITNLADRSAVFEKRIRNKVCEILENFKKHLQATELMKENLMTLSNQTPQGTNTFLAIQNILKTLSRDSQTTAKTYFGL